MKKQLGGKEKEKRKYKCRTDMIKILLLLIKIQLKLWWEIRRGFLLCVYLIVVTIKRQATSFRGRSVSKGNWQNHIVDHVILESNLKKHNRHLIFMKDKSSRLLDSPNLFSNYFKEPLSSVRVPQTFMWLLSHL